VPVVINDVGGRQKLVSVLERSRRAFFSIVELMGESRFVKPEVVTKVNQMAGNVGQCAT